MGEGVIDFCLFGMGSLMLITNMIVLLFVYGMDKCTTKRDVFSSHDILHKKIGTRNWNWEMIDIVIIAYQINIGWKEIVYVIS